MRVAALDFGTNTCLLLIAEVDAKGEITKVLHDEAEVVRLGQDVNRTKRLHPEALARAEETFKRYSATIAKFAPAKTLACATSAARDVSNGDELISLAARYKIPVQIISGQREAELTFQGTIDGDGPIGIIDVGGGSTEFILGNESGIQSRMSLDIGAVRLTEMFVTKHPMPADEISQMTDFIHKKLATLKLKAPDRVIAVAGTPTTLAAIDQEMPFESEKVHGYKLTNETIATQIDKMAKMTVDQRRELAGMEPKRADVIVAGALILLLSAEALGVTVLEVSIRGLRYGVAKALAQTQGAHI